MLWWLASAAVLAAAAAVTWWAQARLSATVADLVAGRQRLQAAHAGLADHAHTVMANGRRAEALARRTQWAKTDQ